MAQRSREEVIAGEIVRQGSLIIAKRHLPPEVARAIKALPKRVSTPRDDDFVHHDSVVHNGMRIVFVHKTRTPLGKRAPLFKAVVSAIRQRGLVAEKHRGKYSFKFDRDPHHFVVSVEGENLKVVPAK